MIAYTCPNRAELVQYSGICGDSQLKSLKAWDAPAYPVVHHFVYTVSMRRMELGSDEFNLLYRQRFNLRITAASPYCRISFVLRSGIVVQHLLQ
jgi:hypothetical protein